MSSNSVENPKGKKPLRRPWRILENIKKDVTEIGCKEVDWIHLAQDRFSGGLQGSKRSEKFPNQLSDYEFRRITEFHGMN
jgi:hypothetical protein